MGLFDKVVTVKEVKNIAVDKLFEERKKELEKKFTVKSKFLAFLKEKDDSFPLEIQAGKEKFFLVVDIKEEPFLAKTILFKSKSEAEKNCSDTKGWLNSQPTFVPSKAFSISPIIHALGMKKGRRWRHAQNELAEEILRVAERFATEEDFLSSEEMKILLSSSVEEINSFLKRGDFDLKIEQTLPGEVFMAARLNIIIQWPKPGRAVTIKARDHNRYYDAVYMYDNESKFSVVSVPEDQKILVLDTESKDKVCMTISDEPKSGFQAWKECLSLMSSPRVPILADYWTAHFPMIDFMENEEIPLAGSVDDSNSQMVLLQSKMQSIFKMDEFGAVAKTSFVAGGVAMGGGHTPVIKELVIDRPFLIWIEKKNVPFPLFAGWFNYGEWKDPKDN